jgi:hypothetical protein
MDQMYELGGRRFSLPPMVARQEKQLWKIVKPLLAHGNSVEASTLVSVLEESLTRVCAIVLVPEGMPQATKTPDAIDELEAWLEGAVSYADLGQVVADFFASGQLGRMLAGITAPLRLVPPTMTGLTKPSAPSPTETSQKLNGSGDMSDLVNVAPILSANGSGGPLNAPSWGSAA